MEKLQALIEKFKTLDMKQVLKKALEDLKPEIEDLNVAQLEGGQRPDGSFLPPYSPVSVRVFGKRPGPMTLRQEGDFHRGITAEVTEQGLDIYGRDMKTEMLELRYGTVTGLSEQSKKTLENDYLKEQVDGTLKEQFREFL